MLFLKKYYWLVKVILMSASLVGILLLSYKLRNSGLGSKVKTVLSLNESPETKPSANLGSQKGEEQRSAFLSLKKQKTFSWCKTRVKKIRFSGKFEIYQKGLNWFIKASGQKERRLPNTPMEKWFAKYCYFQGHQILSPTPLTKSFKVCFDFITQESTCFLTLKNQIQGQPIFVWKGQKFTSKLWSQGLSELSQFLLTN